MAFEDFEYVMWSQLGGLPLEAELRRK